ncbi:PaaX family transcriptional regulator [Amycolatopsis suaedae]|uniref:PaaX family transcriptional regulator n=1 Tax=Amycolatopsis suaedae TaxID=2510978 RepID=A0A4V2EL86_9PSEU|nr:PaaX family transcriptional regulator [Amycolatopsis suaedae]
MTLLGSYLHDRRGQMVWSGGLVALLAELGFSEGAARIALARLARRGLLERVRRGRQVHYALTKRTVDVLAEGDERLAGLGRGRTAGEWTVLWHAIPHDRRLERERLVRRLRFLGFGSVQDATWLAAHDREAQVAELLRELDVTDHAGVLLGRPAASLDVRAFAARAWDLDRLAERYAAFADTFTRPVPENPAAAFALRTRLVHGYRQFLTQDPELPEELVPAPPRRAEAVRLFHDLYPALAPAAQRHFDEVTHA